MKLVIQVAKVSSRCVFGCTYVSLSRAPARLSASAFLNVLDVWKNVLLVFFFTSGLGFAANIFDCHPICIFFIAPPSGADASSRFLFCPEDGNWGADCSDSKTSRASHAAPGSFPETTPCSRICSAGFRTIIDLRGFVGEFPS